ncbi:heterokaryon incompatibility protein-domain-containing protein, partial [Lasiosphaeria hispida]
MDLEVPTRLLDLSAPGLGEDLVLYETAPTEAPITYATLSHRWGTTPPITTTISDLQKNLKRIYIESLPKTFREAVTFARKMEVRYLWIDSLCIIQDSTADKDREIPKMASIYSNAIFNIAASAAADSSEGLFRERSPSLFQPIELPLNFELADGTKKSCFATLSRLLHRQAGQKLQSTLDGRGWIFQERALSRRVFSFDGHMLWFECREIIASENLPRGASRGSGEDHSHSQDRWLNLLPQSASRSLCLIGDLLSKVETAKQVHDSTLPTQIDTLLHHWYRAMPGYLLRTFTHETDRLPAISSLASRISALSPDNTYIAGHFRPNLILSICWTLGSPSTRSPIRFQPPRAPTWSWASLNGPV